MPVPKTTRDDATEKVRPPDMMRRLIGGGGGAAQPSLGQPSTAHERCTTRVHKHVAVVATFGDPNCMGQSRRSSGSVVRFTERVGNRSFRGEMPISQP